MFDTNPCTHAISIHSLPKEGDRQLQTHRFSDRMRFQSTPSPKRETIYSQNVEYPPHISIHSLPKEGDTKS